jgi:hypothetical protein
VLNADAKAKRIALSMKTQGAPAQRPKPEGPRPPSGQQQRPQQNRPPVAKPQPKPQPPPPTLEDKISLLANRWKNR